MGGSIIGAAEEFWTVLSSIIGSCLEDCRSESSFSARVAIWFNLYIVRAIRPDIHVWRQYALNILAACSIELPYAALNEGSLITNPREIIVAETK